MIVTIKPSAIKGNILAPTSKSSMQRACAAALLHDGETTIANPGKSNDDLAAIDVIQKLGATIVSNNSDKLVVNTSSLKERGAEMNCGESGLGIRMFTPLAALSNQPITINGTGSLLTRPMDFFDDIFPLLGIEIKSKGGKLPLEIKGPLQPTNITIESRYR